MDKKLCDGIRASSTLNDTNKHYLEKLSVEFCHVCGYTSVLGGINNLTGLVRQLDLIGSGLSRVLD